MVSIRACHVRDPGSIPGRGGIILELGKWTTWLTSFCNDTAGTGRDFDESEYDLKTVFNSFESACFLRVFQLRSG